MTTLKRRVVMSSDASDLSAGSTILAQALSECEIAAVRGKAPEQLGALLDRYRSYLLAIATRELSPQLAAKIGASDLVQETMALGYGRFPSFRGTSSEQLGRWLRRILLNQIQNVAKSYAADKRNAALEQPLDSRLVNGDPTASGAAVSREEWESFHAALARLPDDLRRVLLLRHRENLSFTEISRMLCRSDATVRRLWAAAVHQLQRELHLNEAPA